MLEARNQLENTLIVLTSDHGEEFLEHGHVKHCRGLWDTVTHVPLMFLLPNGEQRKVIDAAVGNIDIVPTILDYLEIESDDFGFEGSSLRSLIDGTASGRGYVFADVGRYRSVDDGRFHLILDLTENHFTLFDVRNDPLEHRPHRRLAGDLADHAGAHVLIDVFQVDFLGDGDAVLGHGGRAKALLENHVAALGSESDLHRSGQFGNTAADSLAGLLLKCNHLRHVDFAPRRPTPRLAGALEKVRCVGRLSAVDTAGHVKLRASWTYSMTARNVVFSHQQHVVIVDLERLARIAAEDDAIADFDLHLATGAVIQQLAVADAEHDSASRLVFVLSGSTMPPAVVPSDCSRSTTTRSPSG